MVFIITGSINYALYIFIIIWFRKKEERNVNCVVYPYLKEGKILGTSKVKQTYI